MLLHMVRRKDVLRTQGGQIGCKNGPITKGCGDSPFFVHGTSFLVGERQVLVLV